MYVGKEAEHFFFVVVVMGDGRYKHNNSSCLERANYVFGRIDSHNYHHKIWCGSFLAYVNIIL